jgi:hypothetical protein
MQLNYQSSTICNITNSIDSSFRQTITYTVDNKVYTKIAEPVDMVINNRPTKNFRYPYGTCTVYYPKNDPDNYTINMNPITTSQIISLILLIIGILTVMWFIYLKYNRNVAGVVGGIDASRSILSIFNRPSY